MAASVNIVASLERSALLSAPEAVDTSDSAGNLRDVVRMDHLRQED
jgi:hypothetical protein